jgi:twinkle protein
MAPIDELYSCGPGLLTVITGIPGHGKSTMVDQIMLNLARRHGQVFAICSFENPIHVHIAKLAEMMTQKHFFETDKAGERMSKRELEDCLPFINEHFKFLSQDDGAKASLPSMMERIKTAVFRWGISGVVIDPYNYIARPNKDDSETQFIDDMLTQLRLLAQYHGIHLWLVAHPTKLMADKEGNYPPPRGYSISGSNAWYAKADFGLTVYRVPDKPGQVKFINWKTRYDWMGKEGENMILYDTATNVYLTGILDDLHPYSPNGPTTYRDATGHGDRYSEAETLFR